MICSFYIFYFYHWILNLWSSLLSFKHCWIFCLLNRYSCIARSPFLNIEFVELMALQFICQSFFTFYIFFLYQKNIFQLKLNYLCATLKLLNYLTQFGSSLSLSGALLCMWRLKIILIKAANKNKKKDAKKISWWNHVKRPSDVKVLTVARHLCD